MLRLRPPRALDADDGFTLIELLLVIALTSVLVSVSIALFVGWRADTIHREAVRQVERAVIDVRQEARRISRSLAITQVGVPSNTLRVVHNGTTTVEREYTFAGDVSVGLPAGATWPIVFDGVNGSQRPFEVARIRVESGSGVLQRASIVSVIPPLGIVAVAR